MTCEVVIRNAMDAVDAAPPFMSRQQTHQKKGGNYADFAQESVHGRSGAVEDIQKR